MKTEIVCVTQWKRTALYDYAYMYRKLSVMKFRVNMLGCRLASRSFIGYQQGVGYVSFKTRFYMALPTTQCETGLLLVTRQVGCPTHHR
jgi:hypothetical protein